MPRVSIIGSGFAGLSAACFLAKPGNEVTVFEKNDDIGGRARAFYADGFTFDMGPSWYWMPDTFERFFSYFGKSPSDYYHLVQLDPGFQMIFGEDDVMTVPAHIDELGKEFERIEQGSASMLKKFLDEAAYKYKVGMGQMVYQPCFSWLEFANASILRSSARLQMFSSMQAHVRAHFKDYRIRALMEFPALFLGATAANIPALYSMMNYAALSLGTWYPIGGMTRIIKAMHSLATDLGVKFRTGTEITRIEIKNDLAEHLHTSNGVWRTDAVVASSDYHHTEQNLLGPLHRNYDSKYWEKKVLAPSSLLFYLGVNKKVKRLIHHNLFFDTPLDAHASEIYSQPRWPSNPLFYVCCPSKTDISVAPAGKENLFILMPLAPGLDDTPEVRERYFHIIMDRLEKWCGNDIRNNIVYKKSYCINDFVNDYHAYKGNAYGLANTLRQTAVLKPSLRNRKVKNLFYAGQLTVPGPGVPPSLISGQLAAEQLMKTFN